MISEADNETAVIAATRRWLERAVIGLNLCPFARAPHVRGQVRFVVSAAAQVDALADDLVAELRYLAEADPEQVETTLLIHPQVLGDFLAYNDFLDVADAVLEELELDGVIQVASFHPQYQFADTAADDIENFSNRSPYPTLHLIREDSLSRVIDSIEDPDAIYERNIERLRALGRAGWDALWTD
ncbi:MAG: DUF1415 domain-containing protein [Lysobacteraceae bacterium]